MDADTRLDAGRLTPAGPVSSSLDSQQLNPDACERPHVRLNQDAPQRLREAEDRRAFGGPAPAPRSVEEAFRHSGWAIERQRVYEALERAHVSEGRLRRFRECGSSCMVQVHRKRGEVRLVARYCGDRLCKPCSAGKGRDIRQNLRTWVGDRVCRFITLTRRADDASLTDALNHLYRSFTKLRALELWKRAVTAGAACAEIKKGKGSQKWNVHLHCIVVGGYLPQKELSDAWASCTGGSHIVDIRVVKDQENAFYYVSKYATKGVDQDTLKDRDFACECIWSLRGRRMFITFGEWWGRAADDPVDEASDWKNLGRFHVVYFAALRGDEWARGILRGLGVAAGAVQGQPTFVKYVATD